MSSKSFAYRREKANRVTRESSVGIRHYNMTVSRRTKINDFCLRCGRHSFQMSNLR